MDALELLVRASNPDHNDKELQDAISSLEKQKKLSHDTSDLLGPIDSIMMLAEQASKISPSLYNDAEKDNQDFGPYFNSPKNVKFRRSRAMSEPWLMEGSLGFSGDSGLASLAAAAAKKKLLDIYAADHFNNEDGGMVHKTNVKQMEGIADVDYDSDSQNEFGYDDANADESGGSTPEHSNDSAANKALTLSIGTLPQMLEQYSSIYNTNGRIGIYTKEERLAIINRFRAKRERRVWKKKIRYSCRKNLADRRFRVKGRFVKAGSKLHMEMLQQDESKPADNDRGSTTGGNIGSSQCSGGSSPTTSDGLSSSVSTDADRLSEVTSDKGYPGHHRSSLSSCATDASTTTSSVLDGTASTLLQAAAIVDGVSKAESKNHKSSGMVLDADGEHFKLPPRKVRRHSIAY